MALLDARELPAEHRIDCDVCIVGSGAAGLGLAHALEGSSLRVVVLESGGLEPDPATTALHAGEIVGLSDFPLDQSRLRYFGGTTNHWTAFVRPFDPLDFEARDWIPDSGWPFSRADLDPYYERARSFLGLPERAFDVDAWVRERAAPWRFEGGRVETRMLQIVPESRRRLGPLHREALERSKNVDVYLHANVLEVLPNAEVSRVHELLVANGPERRVRIRAGRFVLAAGGIENARLLLLSSSVAPKGLGNDRDLVGRTFANHPEAGTTALLVANLDVAPPGLYEPGVTRADGGVSRGYLQLSPVLQRKARLAGCWLQPALLGRRRPRRRSDVGQPLPVAGSTDPDQDGVARALAELDERLDTRGVRLAKAATGNLLVKAFVEPTPERSSRVRLGDARDAFGQRKVVLDWKLHADDERHLRRSLRALAREVGASGIGRIQVTFPKRGFAAVEHRGSFHHMGTTRMHSDPARGVVDADGRVHGLANLFVAGSSVFPTFGTANPTLTILALTFRLADHLQGAER